MKRIFGIVLVMSGLLTLACSDSGDDVTGPSGPTISIANVTAEEGNALVFVITLSQVQTEAVTFSYATTNRSATAGSDYTAMSGTDTIPAGTNFTSVAVATTDDVTVETTETLTMVISAAVNATIATGTATGSITDNDGVAFVSYSASVRPILLNRCATGGCHGTGSTSGGFSMGNATYAEVRLDIGNNGAIISAGNAAASPLYTKTTSSPPFGSRMPFGQAALSTADQLLIRDWINEGANDN